MISNSPLRAILGLLVLVVGAVAQPAAEAPPPSIIAITGGRVLLDPAKAPEPATIVVTDGKITAVGRDVVVPKGATIIDASGRIVAPSWIDAGNAGLIDPTALRERATASDYVADLLVPFSPRLRLKLLAAGVGCIYVDLGRSGRLYRSPTAAVALVDPDAAELPVVERAAGVSFRVAPANTNQADLTASTASLRNITAAFSAADRHRKAIEKHEKAVKDYEKKLKAWKAKQARATKSSNGKKGDPKKGTFAAPQEKKPGSDPKKGVSGKTSKTAEKDEKPKPPAPLKPDPGSDTVLRILDGQAPLRVEAHWREDILAVLGIAKEKKVHVSILGGSEAWRCIDELKEAGASVVVGPPIRIEGARVLEYQARADLAKVLAENDIPFAFMTGLGAPTAAGAVAGYRFDSLPLVASLAIAEGLEEADALRALTAQGGKVIGMGDRLGQVKVGYDAALQILSGPPLDPDTVVERMVLGDRVIDVKGEK